LNIRSIF